MEKMKALHLSKKKQRVLEQCNVFFGLRNLSSDNLLIEEQKIRFTWKCCKRDQMFTVDALKRCLSDMLRTCLSHNMDYHEIHRQRLKGVAIIKKISTRTNYSDLGMVQIVALLWSCLSVVHHFHLRATSCKSYKYRFRIREYQNAIIVYERVLVMLLPQLFNSVIKALITFFSEACLWELESYVTTCINKILAICKESNVVINYLLDVVEICSNPFTVGDILRIIQNLLSYGDWALTDCYILYRFLELYRRSIMNEEFESLRWSLESCLIYGLNFMARKELIKVISLMLTWVAAVSPLAPLQFTKVMEHAAGTSNVESFAINLNRKFMLSVMEMVVSQNRHRSILGCRLLYIMLDRKKNGLELMRAKLYCIDGDYSIKIADCSHADRNFIQKFNDVLHAGLLTALMHHGFDLRCMEAIFGVIAVVVVEIPCSFTAALAVSFGMSAQEFVLAAPGDLEEAGFRIHASVLFLISLVCYVHNAKILFEYVCKVMGARARRTPQLLPPVRAVYDRFPLGVARDELYFEDYEIRYGLVCCFKSSEAEENLEEEKYSPIDIITYDQMKEIFDRKKLFHETN